MSIPVLETIFWFGVGLLLYTYLGYPLFLFVIIKILPFRREAQVNKTTNWRSVSLLIAAYNEEKVIGAKLENSLRLDYPIDLLHIWVASDGSSDGTNEIVRKYIKQNDRIHLLEFPRMGKAGVLNKAIDHIESDIIVFSDANTEYSLDAIKDIVKYFDDPKVGCVSGRLVYRNPGKVVSGKGESCYWRYETILKKMESKIGYVAGANGALYAIRRELFSPLSPRTINDDFTTSMRIVKKGYKSIYEQNAIAYEDVAPNMEGEFRRHIRDGAGHYIAIVHLLGLLNPFLGIRAFIYWSHRILRWVAPFMLIFIFLLNIFLINNIFYLGLFFIQIIFYIIALIALISEKLNMKLPFFLYIPFYFCNLNLALLYGFMKVISGVQKTTWESTIR